MHNMYPNGYVSQWMTPVNDLAKASNVGRMDLNVLGSEA